MKAIEFGKGLGFADETRQALPQSVEPTLNMIGFATVFTHRLMPVRRKHTLIRLPEIAERVAAFVGQRDTPPEVQTTSTRT